MKSLALVALLLVVTASAVPSHKRSNKRRRHLYLDRPESTMTVHVCENQFGNIRCPNNKMILVRKAYFGRGNNEVCPNTMTYGDAQAMMRGLNPRERCKKDVTKKIHDMCSFKKCCKVESSADEYGAPCEGVSNYLTVQYKCRYRQRTICEDETEKLSCPKERAIRIVDANYGRRNNWGCRRARGDIYTAKSKEINPKRACVANVRNLLQKKCNGKEDCKVTSSNKFFGRDPCRRMNKQEIFKFARVAYKCLPTKPYKKYELSVCEGSSDRIECPAGTLVKVTSAVYGRADRETCPAQYQPTAAWLGNTGCAKDVSKLIKDKCQWSLDGCAVSADSDALGGDPCKGTAKYLHVKWNCIENN